MPDNGNQAYCSQEIRQNNQSWFLLRCWGPWDWQNMGRTFHARLQKHEAPATRPQCAPLPKPRCTIILISPSADDDSEMLKPSRNVSSTRFSQWKWGAAERQCLLLRLGVGRCWAPSQRLTQMAMLSESTGRLPGCQSTLAKLLNPCAYIQTGTSSVKSCSSHKGNLLDNDCPPPPLITKIKYKIRKSQMMEKYV